ncbi:MAG: hypothetical protein ACI8QS_000753 [Planctomycetota bacterium]|jgi:hypothetical protein
MQRLPMPPKPARTQQTVLGPPGMEATVVELPVADLSTLDYTALNVALVGGVTATWGLR